MLHRLLWIDDIEGRGLKILYYMAILFKGIVENKECRACGADIITMEHFLCHCLAFKNLAKLKFFNYYVSNSCIRQLKHARSIAFQTIPDVFLFVCISVRK